MSLNNLIKSVLVTTIIYFIAFMVVVWAPWDPSPRSTYVIDDFRRDQVIGFWIYQAFAIVLFLIIWSGRPFSGWLEFFSILALIMAPLLVLGHYGEEKLFVPPWSILQMICTAALVYIAFKMKDERRAHIPA